MKALILAGGILVVGASGASAYEGWKRDHHPYAQKHHSVCQDKARRLHVFEMRASRDGRITRDERRTIEVLQRDIKHTCGGFRHH